MRTKPRGAVLFGVSRRLDVETPTFSSFWIPDARNECSDASVAFSAVL